MSQTTLEGIRKEFQKVQKETLEKEIFFQREEKKNCPPLPNNLERKKTKSKNILFIPLDFDLDSFEKKRALNLKSSS